MKHKVSELRLGFFVVLAALLAVFLFPKPVVKPAISNPIETKVAQAQKPVANIANGKSIRVPILMYHHVGNLTHEIADLVVSPADFEIQVEYFKNLGYQTVSLEQVYDSLENSQSLPAKPIVFTFDDGYKDVFVYAIPILQKYGYTGTFAIATNLLGRPDYAVWADVISAQRSGMEIVSHTENHLDLANSIYSEADLKREIFDSKALLELRLGVPVDFFVYPYGKYNERVLRLVKEAGYKMALTTAYGTSIREDSLLTTPRVRVHGGSDGLEKLKKVFLSKPHSVSAQTSP